MKIIYLYKKDRYAAIMAAYTHLNFSSMEDFKFIDQYKKEGYFYYLGMDEEFNEVYLLYSKKRGPILKNLLKGFAHICDEEIKVIDLDYK